MTFSMGQQTAKKTAPQTWRTALANFTFVAGNRYTKNYIYKLCRVPPNKQRGNRDTGYTQWGGDWFFFCYIGAAGRAGSNHENFFDEGLLNWKGKTGSHVGQESIKSLLYSQEGVHVFHLAGDRSAFEYAGEAAPASFQRTTPVQITW